MTDIPRQIEPHNLPVVHRYEQYGAEEQLEEISDFLRPFQRPNETLIETLKRCMAEREK